MELLSQRAKSIQPSLTLSITARAKAMKAVGCPVLDFSVGEPDFHTPEPIKSAAIDAIRDGFTKYTAAGGIPELKDAIAAKYEKELGLTCEPTQILVSNGGRHALHSVLQALLDPGDEVIVPSPYWLSYPDMVTLSGGRPVIVNTCAEEGYKMRPDALKDVMTPKTKALIINSPSNPTGAVYTSDELKAIGCVLESSDALVISDDVYEKFVYDGGSFVNILSVAPGFDDRVVIINSASKTYSMPGWRMGYALGPAPLISAATRIQGQATSCPGSISQKALTFALQMEPEIVETFRRSFEARRDLMMAELAGVNGVRIHRPAGAFYLFADVSALMSAMSGIDGSVGLCEYLLDHHHIACVPGKAFGDDRCVRFSFVAAETDIREGIERLKLIAPS